MARILVLLFISALICANLSFAQDKTKNDSKKSFFNRKKADKKELQPEINYKDTELNGPYKNYGLNGKVKEEGNHKDGKLDGLCRTYYENGNISTEENYRDGNLNGVCKRFYRDGKIQLGKTYKDGQLDGPWKEYYRDGQLRRQVIYKDGKPGAGWQEFAPKALPQAESKPSPAIRIQEIEKYLQKKEKEAGSEKEKSGVN